MGVGIYPQTSVTQFPSQAFAGMLGDSWYGQDVESAVVSETAGVEAGVAVILDGQDTALPGWAQKVKYPVDANSVVEGFTVFKTMKEPTSPRFSRFDSVSVLKKGRIWCLVQNTVSQGDDVYAWYASSGGTKGSIRNDAGSTQAVKVRGARVLRGAATAGFALVDFNWPMASADASVLVGGSWSITTLKTGDYTAVIGELVKVNPTGGVITITLPTAVGVSGRAIKVVDFGAAGAGASATHTITIATTSSQTIDGASTKTITVNAGELTFVSDGANWMSAAAA